MLKADLNLSMRVFFPFFLDGPNKERREKEGAFSHQRGGDQRVHHQCPQAHPWSVSTAGVMPKKPFPIYLFVCLKYLLMLVGLYKAALKKRVIQ